MRPRERQTVRVASLPGVSHPRGDALLLAAVMHARGLARGARVLDVFAGSGVLAVTAALEGAREVTAVDLSRRAVLTTRLNASRNGVRVRALRGDLFAPVAGERFDLIVADPPRDPGDSALLDRLCDQARGHLAAGGRLLLVQSPPAGERATLDRLGAAGLDAHVLERRGGLVIAAEAAQTAATRAAAPARITPYRDGPYLLRGAFELTDQDGEPIASTRGTVALCRCGRSQIRPFCDGTHKLVGFRSASAAEGPARPAAQTHPPPPAASA
jgi:release factor glutamine methyltransferase